MKICSKCGTRQSDNRTVCLECGEILGKSITKYEADIIIKKEHTEQVLAVSILDKIVGFISLIGAIGIIIYIIIFNLNLNFEQVIFVIFSILFYALSSISALKPKLLWELEKYSLSFRIDDADEAEPSFFYFISRKITIYVCFILAVTLLILSFIYKQPIGV